MPCIDFADMRRRVGVPETGGDILDIINGWPEAKRAAAYATIAEIEEQALRDMKVMPGAEEVCSYLDSNNVPRALVTRNVSSSVDFFHRTAFNLPPFFPALSREWTPYKPDPAALHHIAEHWGVDASELVMIGDSPKDDIVCGNRAGALTILFDSLRRYSEPETVNPKAHPELTGERAPDYVVTSLMEVADILKSKVCIVPPPNPDASAAC